MKIVTKAICIVELEVPNDYDITTLNPHEMYSEFELSDGKIQVIDSYVFDLQVYKGE